MFHHTESHKRREHFRPVAVLLGILLSVGVCAPADGRRVMVAPEAIGNLANLTTALKEAAPGDTLFLTPGLYRGIWDLKSGVSLFGLEGPDSTILDADGGRYVFSCRRVDSTTVIAGLTIRNGRRDHANSGGGGFYLYESSPVILNNVFCHHLGYLGPGVYASYRSHPIVAFNVFYDNEAYLGGAVAAYQDCAPLVYNNVIYDNRCVSGGGVLCLNSAPVIDGNTIVGNQAAEAGGGSIYCDSSPALIRNNVLAYNAGSGAVFWLDDDYPATIRSNLVWENEGGAFAGKCPDYRGRDGNCSEDPGFADLGQRRLWRTIASSGSASCLVAAGAVPWDRHAVPAVPDSLLQRWRAWRAEHPISQPSPRSQ